MQQILVNPNILAETEPDPYGPGRDVAAWRRAQDGRIILETFRRSNGTFGFRYQAWVEWFDAGGEAVDCSWHEIRPDSNLVTDDIKKALVAAEHHAASKCIALEPDWNPNV